MTSRSDCSITEERDTPRERAYRLANGINSSSTVTVSFFFMPGSVSLIYVYTTLAYVYFEMADEFLRVDGIVGEEDQE